MDIKNIKQNPKKVYRNTLKFLGLKNIDINNFKIINKKLKKKTIYFKNSFVKIFDFGKKNSFPKLLLKMLEKIMHSDLLKKDINVEISNEYEKKLKKEFYEEVKQLSELCN
ncbi:MAG: hypothetical protein ACQEQC_07635, partial [Elusimicrobiota bacterium]